MRQPVYHCVVHHSVWHCLCRHPRTVDAIIAFETLEPANVSYAIRVNHTSVPSTQELLNYFSPAPDPQYQQYWYGQSSLTRIRRLLQWCLRLSVSGCLIMILKPADVWSFYRCIAVSSYDST